MPSSEDRLDRRGREPSRGIKAKLGTTDIVSYEDLLIAQYIDGMKKGPAVNGKSE